MSGGELIFTGLLGWLGWTQLKSWGATGQVEGHSRRADVGLPIAQVTFSSFPHSISNNDAILSAPIVNSHHGRLHAADFEHHIFGILSSENNTVGLYANMTGVKEPVLVMKKVQEYLIKIPGFVLPNATEATVEKAYLDMLKFWDKHHDELDDATTTTESASSTAAATHVTDIRNKVVHRPRTTASSSSDSSSADSVLVPTTTSPSPSFQTVTNKGVEWMVPTSGQASTLATVTKDVLSTATRTRVDTETALVTDKPDIETLAALGVDWRKGWGQSTVVNEEVDLVVDYSGPTPKFATWEHFNWLVHGSPLSLAGLPLATVPPETDFDARTSLNKRRAAEHPDSADEQPVHLSADEIAQRFDMLMDTINAPAERGAKHAGKNGRPVSPVHRPFRLLNADLDKLRTSPKQ